MRWAIVAMGLAGCRCGDAPPAADDGPPHFADWPALVAAASRGDVALAKDVARDLEADGLDALDPDAAGRVGGALGFVVAARAPDDLVEGVVAAASACGACHEGRVPGPPAPIGVTHDVFGWQAVHALLFPTVPVAAPAAGDDPVAAELSARWMAAPDREARAASVLSACQPCHGAG